MKYNKKKDELTWYVYVYIGFNPYSAGTKIRWNCLTHPHPLLYYTAINIMENQQQQNNVWLVFSGKVFVEKCSLSKKKK